MAAPLPLDGRRSRKLDVYTDWIYGGRFQEVFGQYTYQGKGIRGFGTTRVGAPTDGYGRLLFLDTLQLVLRARAGCARTRSSRTGRPECSATASTPRNPWVGGYAHPRSTPNRKRGPGTGEQYRITAPGPGVTPDVMWQGPGLHAYDRQQPGRRLAREQMNAERDQIRAGYGKCAHT